MSGNKTQKAAPAPQTADDAGGSAAVNAPVEKEAPKDTKKPEKSGFCVYLGPTIHAGITSGKVFKDGKAKVLKQNAALIEKYPLVSALIVPGDEVSASRVQTQTPGNLLYEKYRQLAEQTN